MKKYAILFFQLFLFISASFAHPRSSPGNAAPTRYFDFSLAAKDTYHKITSLRFVEAHSALNALQRNEPDNLVDIYL